MCTDSIDQKQEGKDKGKRNDALICIHSPWTTLKIAYRFPDVPTEPLAQGYSTCGPRSRLRTAQGFPVGVDRQGPPVSANKAEKRGPWSPRRGPRKSLAIV